MLLSVLIPVYKHHPALLLEALAKQLAAVGAGEVEVLVGDDSADETASSWHQGYASSTHPWLRIFRHQQNLGRSKARNFLMKQASGRFLWFLDGDVTLPDGLLVAYLEKLQQQPVVWCSGIACPNEAADNLRNWYTRQVETKGAAERNKAAYRSFSAANFAMPAAYTEKVQFPENHSGYGHEDTHFGLQLLEAGHEVKHFDMPVWHASNESDRAYLEKVRDSVANLAQLYHTERLFQKYRSEIKLIRLWEPLSALGMAFFASLLTSLFERQLLQGKRSKRLLHLYKLGWFDRYFRTGKR